MQGKRNRGEDGQPSCQSGLNVRYFHLLPRGLDFSTIGGPPGADQDRASQQPSAGERLRNSRDGASGTAGQRGDGSIDLSLGAGNIGVIQMKLALYETG